MKKNARAIVVTGAILMGTSALVSRDVSADSGRLITCGSYGLKRGQCSTGGPVQSIQVVQRLSDADCKRGSSWGYEEPGIIWVTDGCRAIFSVTGPVVYDETSIQCESHGGEDNTCEAGREIRSVFLERQVSESPCVPISDVITTNIATNASWGIGEDRRSLWVSQGCRGSFNVRFN